MKHIFSSGEEIYKKNVKELEQGTFTAEYLNYDKVEEDTLFEAVGKLDSKPVSVEFRIRKDSFGDVGFRSNIGILMQSDIIVADWESYKIKEL